MIRAAAVKYPSRTALATWMDSVARHPELLVILFFSALVRLFLAESNSYWLDELYSVTLYGIRHDSAGEALRYLASTSVHPPLYQWVLFHWMEAFGHSELATRSLSSLYGVLAILFLYLFSLRAFGKRVAIGAALVYSISFTSVFYSVETRSYAQTMFLSMLSLYALQRYARSLGEGDGWRKVLLNPALAGFTASNVLLLLTHYYNVTFIAAQALFCCIQAVYVSRPGLRRRFLALAKAVAPFALQLLIFLLLWAGTLKGTAERYLGRRSGAGNTTWDGPTQGPWTTFHQTVLAENFPAGTIAVIIFLALLAAAFGPRILRLHRGPGHPTVARTWWWLLVACCAIMPFVFYYLVTVVVGAERISARYFVFAIAPVALLLVLALESFVGLSVRMLRSGHVLGRRYVRNSTLVAVLFAAAVAGPGAYRAATHAKHDWRGIAKQVVELVQGDPDHDYLIYETSFRREPTLDYYLHRFSDGQIGIRSNMTRMDERRRSFRYRKELDEMNQADYIVVVFTHHRERQFRHTVRALSEDFQLLRRQLDDSGHGYILFGPRG